MTNEEIKPTEKDRKTARQVMEGVNLHAFSDLTYDELQSRIAQALASQREADAQKCDAVADHASQEETMNDAIGEDFLIPTVKFWEGKRKAATECAAAIRTDSSEGAK